MTYKQKLTDLFCEVSEIKEQRMELKEWCKIEYSIKQSIVKTTSSILFVNPYSENIYVHPWHNYKTPKLIKREDVNQIIWNPLGYHHLMMYCAKYRILIQFNIGLIVFLENDTMIELDYTKSFSEQNEEVYEWIFIDNRTNK